MTDWRIANGCGLYMGQVDVARVKGLDVQKVTESQVSGRGVASRESRALSPAP